MRSSCFHSDSCASARVAVVGVSTSPSRACTFRASICSARRWKLIPSWSSTACSPWRRERHLCRGMSARRLVRYNEPRSGLPLSSRRPSQRHHADAVPPDTSHHVRQGACRRYCESECNRNAAQLHPVRLPNGQVRLMFGFDNFHVQFCYFWILDCTSRWWCFGRRFRLGCTLLYYLITQFLVHVCDRLYDHRYT
jgi:hypothetical protein